MAIGDYVYLLKPQSGDSSPHNELNGAQTISGGTIALVDLGGGDYVWRFSGASSAGAVDSRTVDGSTTGGGVTIAMVIAVTTNRSASDDRLLWYGVDSADFTEALQLRRGSTTSLLYPAYRNGGATAIFGATMSAGTTRQTIVLRLRTGATDFIDQWWSGGGAGPGADSSDSGSAISGGVGFDTLSIFTANQATIEIKRFAIWHEELADADCDAIRDDFDTALGLTGDTTPPTITGPTGAAGAASISVNVNEGTTACGTWTADESVTWSISGTDAAFFSINSSTGALAFLSAPVYASPADSGANNVYDLVVTATDTASPTPNTSNQSVAVNVVQVDSTAPSAPGTPAFSSITKTGCTVTWTAATDNVAVTGYERRFNGGAAVDLGNVLTFDMAGQTPGATVTVEVRAYDAAGLRGAWSTADVTFPIYGFAFSTLTGTVFGAIVGTFTDIEREAAAASWTIYVHNDDDREVILNTGALTIDSNGRVPNFSHASLDPITYFLSGRRPSDGAWVAGRLTATDLS